MEKKTGDREGQKQSVPTPQPTKDGNPDLFRTINAEEWKDIQATFLQQKTIPGRKEEPRGARPEPPGVSQTAPAPKHLSFTDLPLENISAEIEQIQKIQQRQEAALQAAPSESPVLVKSRSPEEHDSQDKVGTTPRVMEVGSVVHQHFRLIQLLGEGTMGRVFLAEHERFRSLYAVKVLHPWIVRQTHVVQQLITSFRHLEQLSHPGLVRPFLLDIEPSTDNIFYFMDFVPGRNLVSIFAQKHESSTTFEKEEVVDFLAKIAEPLSYAHQHQRFGGNLQPSRILWTERRTDTPIQLLSFGLLSAAMRQDRSPLQSGPLYAMYYAPPEMQQAGAPLSAASDVFSVGVIIYQMLTGALPIGIARPPSEVSSRWPVALDRVMIKAMKPLPQERYASIEEFVSEFTDAFKAKSNVVQLSLSGESSPELPAASTFQPVISSPTTRSVRPPSSHPSSRSSSHPPSHTAPALHKKSTPPRGVGSATTSSKFPPLSGMTGPSGSVSMPSMTSLDAAEWQGSLTPRSVWPAHDKTITSMALSPDGSLLASAGEEQCLKIWATSSWSQLHNIPVGAGRLKHIQWSHDNRYVAFVDDQNAVQIWSVAYTKRECTLAHDTRVHALAWLQNGSQLYAALENGTIVMWNLPMRRMIAALDAHVGAVLTLRYEPQLNVLVSGGADQQIKLWSVEKKNLYQNLCQCKSSIFAMAFSPTASTLATGHTDALVQLRDFRSGHLKCSLHGHEGTITALIFGPQERWLASAATDCTIRLWNTRQFKQLAKLEHHSTPVHSLCLSNDGLWMVSACNDNQIRIWDTSRW